MGRSKFAGEAIPSKVAQRELAEKLGVKQEWVNYREALIRTGTPRTDAYRAAYVRFLAAGASDEAPTESLGNVLGTMKVKADATADAGSPNKWRPEVGDEDLSEAQQIKWAAESLGQFRATGELPLTCPSKGSAFWFDFGLRHPDKFAGALQKESQRAHSEGDGEIVQDGQLRIDELDAQISTLQHAAVQPCPEGQVEESPVPA